MLAIVAQLHSLHQLTTIMQVFINYSHHLHLQVILATQLKNHPHVLTQKQFINELWVQAQSCTQLHYPA